jgi:hypothetical protein
MPILPIIDLLILLGWTTLFGAFALKAIHITTHYRPELFGMGPMDMVITAAAFLLFALALAARTWVKAHEVERANTNARVNATLDAYSEVRGANSSAPSAPSAPNSAEARASQRDQGAVPRRASGGS